MPKLETTMPESYRPLEGSERAAAPHATLLGPADDNEEFRVTILVRRRPDGEPIGPDAAAGETDGAGPALGRDRTPMSEDEFVSKHGADPDDLEKVAQFARAAGLTVVETHAARRTVVVRGTVGRMNKAFGVSLGRYERPREAPHARRRGASGDRSLETYRGREGFIYVPASLSDVIVGVFGLDNRRVTRTWASPGDPPVTGTVTVAEVTRLYKFPPPGPGIGSQTIGIITPAGDLGGYLVPDLETYFASIGQPMPQVIPISVDGYTNGTQALATTADALAGGNVLTFANTGYPRDGSSVEGPGIPESTYVMDATDTNVWLGTPDGSGNLVAQPLPTGVPSGTRICFNLDLETTQDIAISASAAPGAKIVVYFSTDTQAGWVDLLGRAIHPDPDDFPPGVSPPSVLSASWYISAGDDPDALKQYGVTAAAVTAMSDAFADAYGKSVTVCIASGDFGSSSFVGRGGANPNPPPVAEGDGYAHVGYPGSDPMVLSVGGTTLGEYRTASGQLEPVEYVWNDPMNNPVYPWGTTGGGVSDFFAVQPWQADAAVPRSINLTITPNPADVTVTFTGQWNPTGRGVPDVAANASLHSGYQGLWLGGALSSTPGNGTSAAAPLWAGLIAVLNSNLGYNLGFVSGILYSIGAKGFCPINPLWPDPALPQLAECPKDNSNNGIPGYPAGAGWDACTGWGSPNGAALLAAIKAMNVQQQAEVCAGLIPGLEQILESRAPEFTNAQFATMRNTIHACSTEGYLTQSQVAQAQRLLSEIESRQHAGGGVPHAP